MVDFCVMLHLNDALSIMKDKSQPFSVEFITCDETKKTGGEIVKIEKAFMCGLPYESKQRIGIKTEGNNYHPMAVHLRLILSLNGQKVWY